jgi:hypothetical protein
MKRRKFLQMGVFSLLAWAGFLLVSELRFSKKTVKKYNAEKLAKLGFSLNCVLAATEGRITDALRDVACENVEFGQMIVDRFLIDGDEVSFWRKQEALSKL